MPYAIQVSRFRENKLCMILLKNGVDAKVSKVPEYVITSERPPEFVRHTRFVRSITEISDQDAESMMNIDMTKADRQVDARAMVTITDGTYAGFNGIVLEIHNGIAKVAVSVFGKTLSEEIPVSSLQVLDNRPDWCK